MSKQPFKETKLSLRMNHHKALDFKAMFSHESVNKTTIRILSNFTVDQQSDRHSIFLTALKPTLHLKETSYH